MSFDYYTRPPLLPERTGAGGVVARLDDDRRVVVALIKEVEVGDAHYVLPKGGVERGESLLQAAIREVHEEAGLTELTHLLYLGARGRVSFDRRYWQTSHYFLFRTTQRESRILDTEHHHSFGWFPIDALPSLFWEDERELIADYREQIVERLSAR